MKLEQIDEKLAALDTKRLEIKQEMVNLVKERERLEAEESAKTKVAGMGRAERAALAQAIASAGAIESKEELGNIG